MLGPGFEVIKDDLHISISTLAQSTAWLILTLGICVFIQNPLAKKYGKRPVYVLSSIFLFAASIWGAVTKEYHSFLASRIVGAIGMAPYEILVQATIGDLYFVHQRAKRLAVWNLFLLGGIAGASFIAGYIIEDLGYRWTFGICAVLFGVFGIGIIFFVPETSFNRADMVRRERERDQVERRLEDSAVVSSHADPASEKPEPAIQSEFTATTYSEKNHHPSPVDEKQSYLSSLRIYTGTYSDAPFWKILLRPFVMLFYPAVIWAFLIYGTTLTWIVVFSVVNGVIFYAPPYNFSVSQVGLTGLSPFVLTIIGECISGPANDWICVQLTKRNKGVYEPEYRLVLMTVVAILGTVGFYGFGASIHYQTHWTGPVLTYGLANMSLAFAGTCVFGYVLDSYPHLAEEAFVAINTRNFLTFGLTYFVNDWLAKDGPLKVFNVLGSCFLAVCALTIPLWVFGKRIRGSVAKMEGLQRFMTD